ncbi:MAG: DinB family protein [Dyadobacter sp.]|uniref:DinB family protein n=1 Tax=Dyadobacter sp. TaxID=1914288 RepID=UPI0032676A54
MIVKDFNDTIAIWTEALNRYSFAELTARPIPGRWSLGQIYMHLIRESGFFFDQVRICASNDENADEKMLPGGREMFLNNSFPDELIEGPPTNALVTQPESKEYLISRLADLRSQIEDLGKLIAASSFNGKTRHPGLGFFSARDWFQFAEMHFRHHLRQKARVEKALAEGSNHFPVK